jgi:hypothetical protein
MQGRNRLRRLLPALALSAFVATLAVPAQARQGSRQAPPAAPAAGWSTEARAFLSRLWSGGGQGLHSLFGAEGASLDPHGGAPTGSGTGTGSAVTVGHGGA